MFSNILNIIIVIGGLIALVTLHEFGHFITAKRFGVKVEEFGIGFPPRLFGKKIGETIYSLNLLPLGAFVKMPGEIEHSQDPRSFFKKPIWQRVLIVAAGVLSFWILAAILFGFLFAIGAPTAISDENPTSNAEVQITEVVKDSPAQAAGLEIGDNILAVKSAGIEILKINKVSELQSFIDSHKGDELTLTIERGSNVFDISVLARANPPAGEGSVGVGLARITIESFPLWKAPWEGMKFTGYLTKAVIFGYAGVINNLFHNQPTGVQLSGPVGIVKMGLNIMQLGWNYFLLFLGQIAVYIAIFNALPIPALDGGKILFLTIEAGRKKPVSQKVEESITTVFFGTLILLMLYVTILDIIH